MASAGTAYICRSCGQEKAADAYYPGGTGKPRPDCKDCTCLSKKQDRLTNPEKWKNYALRSVFGIGLQKYQQLFAAQSGRCAICGTTKAAGRWNTLLHVDHDHQSGKVRGLLCGHCNLALGNMKDDPARLRAAADYIERSI
jgi:hypothetical protein